MDTQANKDIMSRNIKRQMEKKGVTNQQICDDLGFKYTTFLDWIKAKTYPRIGKIEAMANYFGCEKSDLIEEKPTTTQDDGLLEGLTEIDMDIVKKLPLLSPEQKKEYSNYLAYLLSKQEL